MIYDQNWIPEVEIYYIHTAPGSHYGGGFPIYAQSLSYNGYFNVDNVGAFLATSNCNFPMHVMTWFAGEVPGVINIIAHDNYSSCTAPGWPTGFYFPCFDPGSNWTPPHDLSDWAYTSSWQTGS